MSQCKAIWYKRPGIAAGHYCILQSGHKGEHETYLAERFTEAQAKYHKPNRRPKNGQELR